MTNSTAIGDGAKVTKSNQVVIGNEDVTDVVLRGAISGATSISCSPTIFTWDGTGDAPVPGKAGDMLVKTGNDTTAVAWAGGSVNYWIMINQVT